MWNAGLVAAVVSGGNEPFHIRVSSFGVSLLGNEICSVASNCLFM